MSKVHIRWPWGNLGRPGKETIGDIENALKPFRIPSRPLACTSRPSSVHFRHPETGETLDYNAFNDSSAAGKALLPT